MLVCGGNRNERAQESVDRKLARLAASQHGVFSRAQAIAAGADRYTIYRRITSGQWERLHPAVFRFQGSSPTWRQGMAGVCLCWGERVAASHASALTLWNLPGGARTAYEITVPRDRRRNHPCNAVVRRSRLTQADVALVDAIPVTTPTRTLIDIAAVLPRDLVEEALDDALRRKLTSIARLRWRIETLSARGRRGVGVIRSLVAERGDGRAVPESVFETRLLRILRAADLADVVSQYPVYDATRVVAILDFAFPDSRVAIEADGYKWHSGRARWERDLSRRNALTALGWKVIHVTWSDLKDDHDVVARIRRVLGR